VLQGRAFDLKAFHDRLLEQGSLPIALVRPKVVVAEPPAPSACGREARKLAIVYSSGALTMG